MMSIGTFSLSENVKLLSVKVPSSRSVMTSSTGDEVKLLSIDELSFKFIERYNRMSSIVNMARVLARSLMGSLVGLLLDVLVCSTCVSEESSVGDGMLIRVDIDDVFG